MASFLFLFRLSLDNGVRLAIDQLMVTFLALLVTFRDLFEASIKALIRPPPYPSG